MSKKINDNWRLHFKFSPNEPYFQIIASYFKKEGVLVTTGDYILLESNDHRTAKAKYDSINSVRKIQQLI